MHVIVLFAFPHNYTLYYSKIYFGEYVSSLELYNKLQQTMA